MKKLTFTFMANVTYSNIARNTKLIVEYEHTGERFILLNNKGGKILSDKESAIEHIKKGKKVLRSNGYYFIKRLAIPTINAKMEKDIWYINNDGDNYIVNKVSKYGRKIHAQLSEENKIPFKL